MESNNVKTYIVGDVRSRLTYENRESLENIFSNLFPGEILPADHLPIPTNQLSKLLESLTEGKKGRRKEITAAANSFLKELYCVSEEKSEVLKQSEIITEVPKEPEQAETKEKVGQMSWAEFIRSLDELDFVFLFVLGVACYGLVYIMGEMGAFWAFVYFFVSVHALRMAKHSHAQNTAKSGITAVWILEFFSFFIHTSMFNKKAWNAAMNGNLPFDPTEYPSFPFYIAVIMAFLFSAAGVYAVTTKRALTVESVEALNYEQQHQIKY